MRRARRFGCVIFVLTVFASAAGAAAVDLVLIAPDDATLRPVRQRLTGAETQSRAAWTFVRGELHGKSVVLTRSEGYPLNAVAATTLALRHTPPRLVIVFGLARAHAPELRAGDIVVSERFAAFDGMITPVAALDQGSDALRWRKRPHLLVSAGEKETPTEAFPADAAALRLAQSLAVPGTRILPGVLGSAHQINREADRLAWLREHWRTSTEDGESAHVAGCALLFGVPVIGFRLIETPEAATPGGPETIGEFARRFVEAWK